MKKKFLISLLLLFTLFGSIKVYAVETAEDLPSKYDLRNDINIRVENQKDKLWCDSYAKNKELETYIQKTKGITYNLSEGYIQYMITRQGSYGTWKSVLESDFPNKEYKVTEENEKRFEEASEKAVIENVEFTYLKPAPIYIDDTSISTNKDMYKVKKYIMKYGGVQVSIYAGDKENPIGATDIQWVKYKGGIYHSTEETETSHAIVIIGWDDNYSKDNFKYEKPENDGAWLILNSWGTEWGNKGTAWVSYEDKFGLRGARFIEKIKFADDEYYTFNEFEWEQEEVKEDKKDETEITVVDDTGKENSKTLPIIVQIVIIGLVLTGIICLVIKIKNKKKTD